MPTARETAAVRPAMRCSTPSPCQASSRTQRCARQSNGCVNLLVQSHVSILLACTSAALATSANRGAGAAVLNPEHRQRSSSPGTVGRARFGLRHVHRLESPYCRCCPPECPPVSRATALHPSPCLSTTPPPYPLLDNQHPITKPTALVQATSTPPFILPSP